MTINACGIKMRELLGLEFAPVAVSFLSEPPEGIPHISEIQPSSCAFWKLAGEGKSFYTDSNDHLNCVIGAYTHNVTLSQEKMKELEAMIGNMINLSYLKEEEIPQIPHRQTEFKSAVYGPLTETRVDPDVVIVRGNAKQVMLLNEAVQLANVGHESVTLGRPTCAMIPLSIQTGNATTSLGCIGNRIYTKLHDDELYLTIPGSKIRAVVDKLEIICRANEQLEAFHIEHASVIEARR